MGQHGRMLEQLELFPGLFPKKVLVHDEFRDRDFPPGPDGHAIWAMEKGAYAAPSPTTFDMPSD